MAFHAEQGVLAIHPAAVVGHANESRAAALDVDFDVTRPGVEAVLHQFPHHRRGPLHDLAGGHLGGEGVGEDANAAHGVCEKGETAL